MLSENQLNTYTTRDLIKMVPSLRGQPDPRGKYARQLAIIEEIVKGRGDAFSEVKAPELIVKEAAPVKAKAILKSAVPAKAMNDLMISRRLLQTFTNANSRGIDFELTFADMKYFMQRKTCHYTGIAFDSNDTKFTMTLERKDNTQGYTRDNVVPVCHFANQLKNKLLERPDGEFRMEPKHLTKFIHTALKEYI